MKLYVILLLVLLFSWNLSASDFYIGGKIGPGVSFVYGDDTDNIDPAAGMSLGFFGLYSPIKFFALQAEFNYEMKGFSLNTNNLDARQYLHYISFPVVAKGMFPVSIVTIQPYLGLNFSFLGNATYKATVQTALGSLTQSKSNKDDYQIFDMGVLFGAEIFITINKHVFLTVDLRFEVNFIKSIEDTDIYNGATQVLVGAGYKF